MTESRLLRQMRRLQTTLWVSALLALGASTAPRASGIIELEPIRELLVASTLGRLPAAADSTVPAVDARGHMEIPDPTVAGEAATLSNAAGAPSSSVVPSAPRRSEPSRVDEDPPVELPQRYFWRGRSQALGHVGYVYLGDYYVVEERQYEKAEAAYVHALKRWPGCAPIQTRLDLLQVFLGDAWRTAEAFQVDLSEELPPVVGQEYAINAESPLQSNRMDRVPPVPTILFRMALETLIENEVSTDAASLSFLRGRLLAFLGEYESALSAMLPLALDPQAEPWNFQAASQCAALEIACWLPERAYDSLCRARRYAGDHPALCLRLDEVKADLARDELPPATEDDGGDWLQQEVKVLGREGAGRWILSSPHEPFLGEVRLLDSPGTGSVSEPHVIYRGEEYWLLTFPLGSDAPAWSQGEPVTLAGYVSGMR